MRTLRSFALSFLLLTGTAFAQQLVTVKCDASTTPSISYIDSTGRRVNDTAFDQNGDGVVEFCVPDGITQVTVSKYSDGRWLVYKVNLDN